MPSSRYSSTSLSSQYESIFKQGQPPSENQVNQGDFRTLIHAKELYQYLSLRFLIYS